MRILPTPIRSILAALTALMAVALIGAWGVGRVVTDRWVWSQWVWWVPGWATVGAVLVLLVVSRLVAGRKGRSVVRGAGWGGLAVVMVWTGVVEWRGWALPGRWLAGGEGARVRIVAWNTAMMPCPGAAGTLAGLKPDLVVISNAPGEVDWDVVKGGMGEGAAIARGGNFTVVSRWPVVRYGSVDLGLNGRIFQFDATDLTPGLTEHMDNGRAAFFEVDTTSWLGRTMIVWAVDMPSDPFLGRAEMMRKAKAAIAAWAGPERRPGEKGSIRAIATGERGFPAPDLIVGDFNTPRGSGSLAGLVGDLKSAYSQAGAGMDGTWPRKWPVFHIDQMFMGKGLKAVGYWIVDPGESMHRVQVGEVVKAPG